MGSKTTYTVTAKLEAVDDQTGVVQKVIHESYVSLIVDEDVLTGYSDEDEETAKVMMIPLVESAVKALGRAKTVEEEIERDIRRARKGKR